MTGSVSVGDHYAGLYGGVGPVSESGVGYGVLDMGVLDVDRSWPETDWDSSPRP